MNNRIIKFFVTINSPKDIKYAPRYIEGVIRGMLPSDGNPQRRHVRCEEHFCGGSLAIWGSQRPENRPVACFQRERAGRPWKKMPSLRICRPGAPEGARGKSVRGVS